MTKLSIVLMSISVRERRKTKLMQTTFYHFRNRGAVIKLPIVHGGVPLKKEGREAVLTKSKYIFLKNPENLTDDQAAKLSD